jgi:hypothetical protein
MATDDDLIERNHRLLQEVAALRSWCRELQYRLGATRKIPTVKSLNWRREYIAWERLHPLPVRRPPPD